MDRILNISEHEEKIFLIYKKIYEEISSDIHPYYLKYTWDYFWVDLYIQTDKQPLEWKPVHIASGAGAGEMAPQDDDFPEIYDRVLTLIGFTISGIILKLIMLEEEPTQNEVLEITKLFVEKRELPESLIPEISSLAVKSIKALGFRAFKKSDFLENRKFKMYTSSGECELTLQGYKIQNSIKHKYSIWINEEDDEFIICGKKQKL